MGHPLRAPAPHVDPVCGLVTRAGAFQLSPHGVSTSGLDWLRSAAELCVTAAIGYAAPHAPHEHQRVRSR